MAIFTFNNPSGSSYFTLETVTTSSFYDASSLTNTLGVYSNFVNLSRDGLVTSSYISSVVVPNGIGSFTFDPTFSVFGTSSVYIRGTGEFTATVSTYSGSFTLTPAQMYGAGILNTFALTPIPAFQARVSADSGSYEAFECQNNVFANTPVNILQTASLLLTPNGYKEGKLYSIIPENGNGDLTVTRATTATRVNSAGLVELVPYNLVTWSEDFSNVLWVKNEATISSNIATAPNGTTIASKLIENTANDSHHIYQNATTSGVNTFSFYAKKGERTFVYAYADSVAQGKCFNLTSGTLGVNIISAPINATIESVGNDWFRCTITVSITIASALRIGLCSADGTFSYLGNGTSGAFIWGAQLVEGTLPLNYLRTETRLNIPRLDYSNGTCPSLLVEPQRTNLALRSEEFDSALVWFPVDVTVSANNTTSPDGTVNADKLIATAVTSTHIILQQPAGSVSGTTSSVSIFAKASGLSNIQILNNAGGLGVANFNLSTGTATLVNGVSASIQDYGNGWYRCIMTYTPTSTGNFNIQIRLADNSGNTTFLGNGTDGIYLYGAQLEAGSYPTSYIPTTSAAVTRNADQVYKTGISSLIGQTEGTIYLEADIQKHNDTEFYIAISNGFSLGEAIYLQQPSSGALYILFRTSGLTPTIVVSSANWNIGFNKIAIAYNSTSGEVFINGASQGTVALSALPTCSQLTIGARPDAPGNLVGSGGYKVATLFKTRLSNSELATLTTI